MISKSDLKKILLIFISWRVGLFVLGFLASFILKYDPSFPYADGLLDIFNLPQWIYSWANFDGVHYITIAQKGYVGTAYIQAFFPLFPGLVYFLNLIIHNALISGLVISNLSFLALLITWFIFIKKKFNKKFAYSSILILLLFPTSLFFGAFYTESLFLTLVLFTFIFVEKKQYLLASFFIFLASSTRIIGILLIPAVLIEILFSNTKFSNLSWNLIKNKVLNIKKYIKPSLIISLGSLGLFLYMAYLNNEFKDPLYFFHVQSEFGGVRQENLISYPQVVYRSIKILLTVSPTNFAYLTYLQNFISGTVVLGIILYSLKIKQIRLSYVVFSLLAFFVPPLTGTFSSMPRYILVCFPIFIVLASWAEKNKIFKYLLYLSFTLLLIINTILFIQGYWLA